MRYHGRNTERGSVVVETVVGFSALMTLVGSGLVVVYVVFARVWFDRENYEAAVCLANHDGATTTCERKFRSRVAGVLPIGRIVNLASFRSTGRVEVRARFLIGSREIARGDQKLSLPLSGGRTRE